MENFTCDKKLQEAVDAFRKTKSYRKSAELLGIPKSTAYDRIKKAAEKGFFSFDLVIPTFRVSQVTTDTRGNTSIQQKPERGDKFEIPQGHSIKGVSALVDETGQEIVKWVKTKNDYPTEDAIRIVVDELKKEITPAIPVKPPTFDFGTEQILNQYTVTDHHLGMLAWGEETGGSPYDLKISEQLLYQWFMKAINLSPDAHTAVFAQLGDFLHIDSLQPVTPTNKNILDADSRLQKIIRVAIRLIRIVVGTLLTKHHHVHVIMASANHDPASSAWLRELLKALYDEEPRVSIDASPDIYYAYQWGDVALFYHHGHKRKVTNVDTVFAAKFKELYGNTKHSYAHIGHLHTDAVVESNLMRVERHRTLAPADAYANELGFIPKRDAKVISYHKKYGEVSRLTISPEMASVDDWYEEV